MPGIAGILMEQGPEQGSNRLETMLQSMMYDTFYTCTSHADQSHGWFCGNVAMRDSYADGMPIINETGDVILFLAGECLGHGHGQTKPITGNGDHRPDLQQLVSLYEEKGSEFVKDLNGLYSGVVLDAKREKVVLFNDRYGIQKVYYHHDEHVFAFASEAKALLCILPPLRKADERSIAEYLCYDCVLENRTYFHGINVLPAGSVWVYRRGTIERRTYFDPTHLEGKSSLRPDEFMHEITRTFESALWRCLRGDQIGIALTGGLDSRLIAACLPADRDHLKALTFGGMYRDSQDVRLARRVAQACGIQHNVLRIGPDFLANYARHATRAVYITDGQADATNLDQVYLNNCAREIAPIKVMGAFGTQVLGRIRRALRYRLPNPALVAANFKSNVEAASVTLMPFQDEHNLSYILKREIPWYWSRFTVPQMTQLTIRAPFLDNDFVELLYRAPDIEIDGDKLELTAIARLNRGLLNIPTSKGRHGKRLPVISAVADRLNRTRALAEKTLNWDILPYSLHHAVTRLDDLILYPLRLNRIVLGFEYFRHYNLWFRRELATYLVDTLLNERTLSRPYWNAQFLRRMVKDHVRGHRRYLSEIRKVLTIELIHRTLIEGDE